MNTLPPSSASADTPDSSILLDARGLHCPLPLLRLKQRMNSMTAGSHITLLATDKNALRDITTWCQHSAHTLLHSSEHDGYIEFRIQKNFTN